jgi:hypothetical protein
VPAILGNTVAKFDAFDEGASAVILWARSAPRSRPLGGHQALQAKVLTNASLPNCRQRCTAARAAGEGRSTIGSEIAVGVEIGTAGGAARSSSASSP